MNALCMAAHRWMVLATLFWGSYAMGAQSEPGQKISLGPFALNIHCSGRGTPLVVVEGGLGDFAFEWILVQQCVERAHRICIYDRGGYGSSDMGPTPRTFAQLNLELHELLRAAGEKPPYVLVGHSFGGPVVRSYAARYPDEVAGMVLAESVTEHEPLVWGDKPHLLKEGGTGKSIPDPQLIAGVTPNPETRATSQEDPLDPIYSVLPTALQQLHRQFASKPSLEATENSQREWSSEYFAEWDRHPQKGLLQSKPLIVLTRAESGYDPSPNYSLDEVDGQRLRAQTELLSLSSNSLQIVLPVGHNLHLEAPDAVAAAIQAVVMAARTQAPLAKTWRPGQ